MEASLQSNQNSQPSVQQALESLARASFPAFAAGLETDFIRALQGEAVGSIGRYQVYSDHTPNETVVFVHDPSGGSDHKYIFAQAGNHTYIVAAPIDWTEYHREILARVRAASGQRAHCPGGGYITVNDDGSLWVGSSSGDFGTGDHQRAKAAFERAVTRSAQ